MPEPGPARRLRSFHHHLTLEGSLVMRSKSAREAAGPVGPLFFVLALALHPAAGAQCNSAPVAVDDEVFHEGVAMVIDVLANDLEPDGEALTVTSVSTTCAGTVSEDFALVSLVPAAPSSEECQISYQVEDERGATASATVAVRSAGVIFQDGFESGDTSAWVG